MTELYVVKRGKHYSQVDRKTHYLKMKTNKRFLDAGYDWQYIV